MQVQSKFDKDTHYVVTEGYVRICREGDKMTMSMAKIPEQAKRFRPEIQEELMAIWVEKHPLIPCKLCGKLYHKGTKRLYCSPECSYEANRINVREKHKQYKVVCKRCGQTFIGNIDKRFCSPECKKKKKWESHLQEKLQLAEANGTTYAEMQRQETLKLVGKVVI